MDFIAYIAIGWTLGCIYTNFKHFQNLRNIAAERGLDLDKMVEAVVVQEEKSIPVLTVEKHGEIIYLFEKKTNTFVCQGFSMDELATKALEYKNISVALVEDGNNEIWFFKGQVKTKAEV